jgi:hypothetical protein
VVLVVLVVMVQMVVKQINQQPVVTQQEQVTEITVVIQEVLQTLRLILVLAAVVPEVLAVKETVAAQVPAVSVEHTQLQTVQLLFIMQVVAVAQAEVLVVILVPLAVKVVED